MMFRTTSWLVRVAGAVMVYVPVLVAEVAAAELPYTIEWSTQIGTAEGDQCVAVAVDAAGNAYISGSTFGSLSGTNAGSLDAFLAKFDAAGNVLWTRQIGTAHFDSGTSVAVDGAGNAYITGTTGGGLGGPNAGFDGAFLMKFDPSGSQVWSRQIGTTDDDSSVSAAVDGAGNAYISGLTSGHLAGSIGPRTTAGPIGIINASVWPASSPA
jgi:hypothetical protein